MKRTLGHSLRFALGLHNEGYQASLEVGKLYRVIPDDEAAGHGYIRVVAESGEDYAFTANRFHVVHLPHSVREVLSHFSRLSSRGEILAEYPLPTEGSGPRCILAIPDGQVFFSENDADQIGEIVPSDY